MLWFDTIHTIELNELVVAVNGCLLMDSRSSLAIQTNELLLPLTHQTVEYVEDFQWTLKAALSSSVSGSAVF